MKKHVTINLTTKRPSTGRRKLKKSKKTETCTLYVKEIRNVDIFHQES